jgi:hypothetical protein
LGLLGKEAYILVEFSLERTGALPGRQKIGVYWFCQGVLLGNILLSEFWKIGEYRKFSFYFAQNLTE